MTYIRAQCRPSQHYYGRYQSIDLVEFPLQCATRNETNVVWIDVENVFDERRLPYARLDLVVSMVAWATEVQVITFPTRTMRNLIHLRLWSFVIRDHDVLTLGIPPASHPLERVNSPGLQVFAQLGEVNHWAFP
jgi:hypothetical protein